MKQLVPILLLILNLNVSFAQGPEAQQELFVINILGSKLHEEPSFGSNILTTVEPGRSVNVRDVITTEESQQIGPYFSLQGNWIRTSIDGAAGYLFSADLSARNPNISRGEAGELRLNLLGELQDETSVTRNVKTDKGEYPKYFESRFYDNGTKRVTIWDGCFNRLTESRDLTFNEIYHQMISDYSTFDSENEYMLPAPLWADETTVRFEGIEATQELQINIAGEQISVSSYDCT